MIIVGITGQLASGKTTLGNIIKHMGYRIFDADKCAHDLLLTKEIRNEIRNVFKKKVKKLFNSDGAINISVLSNHVFNNVEELRKLELILHPRIKQKQKIFLYRCAINKNKIVFLDIPLLDETKIQTKYDYIIRMFVNKNTQEQRILRRENMNRSKMKFILDKQRRIRKISYSNHIIKINSGNGRFFVLQSFKKFVRNTRKKIVKEKLSAWF